jgi:hypothetical protein
MATWEYAEVAWEQTGVSRLQGGGAWWSGPDGSSAVKVHGVVALNQAVRDGWEVIDYKASQRWSSCLLRRPLQ